MSEGRAPNGRYLKGHSGGPGRPRRAVEMDYLVALADEVSLADWRAIAARAVLDSKAGNAIAREWLSRYIIGPHPASLTKIAAMEGRDEGPEHEIAEEALRRERRSQIDRLFADDSLAV